MSKMPRKRRRNRRNRSRADRVRIDLVATPSDSHGSDPANFEQGLQSGSPLAESAAADTVVESNRRGFIKGSGLMLAGGAAAGAFAGEATAESPNHSEDFDRPLRVGLIGCGVRGTRHAIELLNSDHRGRNQAASDRSDPSQKIADPNQTPIRLVAMADYFEHQLQSSYRTIRGRSRSAAGVQRGAAGLQRSAVDVEHRHIGPDAAKRMLDEEIDLVILASPTSFRGEHFRMAVQAGKHCLVESPLGTTVEEIESVQASIRSAAESKLVAVSGFELASTNRFHQLVQQVQGGMIGDLLYASCFATQVNRGLSAHQRGDDPSDYRIRNWQHFSQFVGDPCDAAMVQSLAMLHQIVGEVPTGARGQFGVSMESLQDLRSGFDAPHPPGDVPTFGSLEYQYDNGFKLLAQTTIRSKQFDGKSEAGRNKAGQGTRRQGIELTIHGTSGYCDLMTGVIRDHAGRVVWKAEPNTTHQDHSPAQRLLTSIHSPNDVSELADLALVNRALIECRNG